MLTLFLHLLVHERAIGIAATWDGFRLILSVVLIVRGAIY